MNLTVITGRLVRDPEMVTLKNGMEKCRFTVAVGEYRGKNKPEHTDFFPCDAWNTTAAFVMKWFKKGSPIMVQGRMNSNPVEKDGHKVTYWALSVDKVEFQMAKKEDGGPEEVPTDPETGMEQVNTDELPF